MKFLINIAKDNSVSSHPRSPAWLFHPAGLGLSQEIDGNADTGAVDAFLQKSEEVLRSPGTVVSCRENSGN